MMDALDSAQLGVAAAAFWSQHKCSNSHKKWVVQVEEYVAV